MQIASFDCRVNSQKLKRKAEKNNGKSSAEWQRIHHLDRQITIALILTHGALAISHLVDSVLRGHPSCIHQCQTSHFACECLDILQLSRQSKAHVQTTRRCVCSNIKQWQMVYFIFMSRACDTTFSLKSDTKTVLVYQVASTYNYHYTRRLITLYPQCLCQSCKHDGPVQKNSFSSNPCHVPCDSVRDELGEICTSSYTPAPSSVASPKHVYLVFFQIQ